MKLNVRIWCVGGVVFEGAIEDAPKTGVLIVRINTPDGHVRDLSNSDYYYTASDGMLYGTDSADAALDYAIRGETVLRGAQVPYAEWTRLRDKVIHER